MPTLSFEQWGVFVVLVMTLIGGLSGGVFGLLGWLDRRRERERQAESAGVPSHDQPLHEKYVAKSAFESHVTSTDERFRHAATARKGMYNRIEALDRSVTAMQERDQHQADHIKELKDDMRTVSARLNLILERLPSK